MIDVTAYLQLDEHKNGPLIIPYKTILGGFIVIKTLWSHIQQPCDIKKDITSVPGR